VRARLWLGLVLCLGGLAAVAEVWAGQLRLDPLGIAAALASAVLLAAYYVLGSRSVAERDPLSLTCWAFAISAVAGGMVRPWWTLPWAALGREVEGTPMWGLAAYLLVLGTIAPYLLVTAALRHLPATSVGIIGTVEPVLASAFAWVLLAEILVGPQIIGGLVVLAGVILAETARAGGPVSTADPPMTDPRRAVTADVPPT
jgi:drug/metabolite transporter (DMT)-like permease